jgi:hypothetical protein
MVLFELWLDRKSLQSLADDLLLLLSEVAVLLSGILPRIEHSNTTDGNGARPALRLVR